MSIETMTVPNLALPKASDSDLDHWCCCYDHRVSLCGFDVSDLPETDFAQASCVVCEDVADQTPDSVCPISGGPCPCSLDSGGEAT